MVIGVTISTALLILVVTLVLLGIAVKILAEVKKKGSSVKIRQTDIVPPSQQVIHVNHTTSRDTENPTSTTYNEMYNTIPASYNEAYGTLEYQHEPQAERDDNDRYVVNQLEYGAVTHALGSDQPDSEDTSTTQHTSSEPIPIPTTSNDAYSLHGVPTAHSEEYVTMQSVQELPDCAANEYVITQFNDEEDPLYTTVP